MEEDGKFKSSGGVAALERNVEARRAAEARSAEARPDKDDAAANLAAHTAARHSNPVTRL